MDWKEFKEDLAWHEKEVADFYKELLEDFLPTRILEVGSGWGIFSRSALEVPDTKIITIDVKTRSRLGQYLSRVKGFEDRIEMICGDSRDILKEMIAKKRKFQFIFVDGDHRLEGAYKDLQNAWDLLDEGGTILLDDLWHDYNWEQLPTGDLHFGVTKALAKFLTEDIKKFKTECRVYGTGKGYATITKI